jgi:hypothetical protein
MTGGFGIGPFGVGEFGIDEYALSEIWLDAFNGSDETGDGSKEKPIKTVSMMLRLMGPGAVIYFVGVPTGQPDYIYQMVDSVFWDLES